MSLSAAAEAAEGSQPGAPPPPSLPPRLSLPPPVTSAIVVGREAVRDGGPCPLSRHHVYLIRVRARGRQWVVRRRYRQFRALHQQVQDEELHAVFPPRSLCAQGGLACALETRQVRLAYYVNELVNTKLPLLPPEAQGAVLRFLEGGFAGAVGEGEEEDDEEDGGGVVRKSLTALAEEDKNVIEVAGRVARRSPRGKDGDGASGDKWGKEQEQPPWAALDAEARAAYDRLRATLTNGITVVKHGRRGGPKRRLIFCNEDATTLYWAASVSSSSSSSSRRRQRPQQQQGLSSLGLADVLEVREGTAPDPDHPGQLGTATLRRRRSSALAMVPAIAASQEEQRRRRAAQSLSLITPARSLDLEALTGGDYRLLLEGFRAAVVLAKAKRERDTAAAGGSRSPRSAGVAGGGGGGEQQGLSGTKEKESKGQAAAAAFD